MMYKSKNLRPVCNVVIYLNFVIYDLCFKCNGNTFHQQLHHKILRKYTTVRSVMLLVVMGQRENYLVI